MTDGNEPPTPKGQLSRLRLLDAGIERMRASGLSGAGINEVVKASGAPKGSVYHFFPGGKDQLVTEALALYAERVRTFMVDAMDGARTPERRVLALFDAFARRLEATDFLRSCAAGAVSLDLDEASLGLRTPVASAFEIWREAIADGLGWVDRRRARSFAGLVLSAIEGAYIRGRAEGNAQAFREAGRWLALLAASEAVTR
ncbi:MAG: TetR/AcrR family transcriptional regulator [Hydrogenophaga sp.]|jgi:TetR/AcrR family transcriptional repressor of lmrAB and yxaGH operons|nr:TetR/AcrR family transcriptional regulator [Hydrogenophaga sp.]